MMLIPRHPEFHSGTPRRPLPVLAALVLLPCLVRPSPAAAPDGPIRLRDVGPGSGVTFRYFDGSRGRHDLPEVMGGGVALIDGDGDGRLDLYLCNGGPIA